MGKVEPSLRPAGAALRAQPRIAGRLLQRGKQRNARHDVRTGQHAQDRNRGLMTTIPGIRHKRIAGDCCFCTAGLIYDGIFYNFADVEIYKSIWQKEGIQS